MSEYDPSLMAKLSVDEAVRNIVANGANPEKVCLLDNFCWPDPVESLKTPDGAEKLAALVETCEGLFDICTLYKTPLVSGKDSMKNDFRGKNIAGDPLNISIKPTLLVTAMGHGNINHCVNSSLKNCESEIYVIGKNQTSLLASELLSSFDIQDDMINKKPDFDFSSCLKTYRATYELLKNKLILSCHDVSEGGLLTAVAEKTFDSDLSVSINVDDFLLETLYGEGPGRFVVSVSKDHVEMFKELLNRHRVDFEALGTSRPIDSANNEQASLRVFQKETLKKTYKTVDLLNSWERSWSL